MEFNPKVKIEIVLPDDQVDPVSDAIEQSARTGAFGDGKIFVSDLQQAVRIRTNEVGDAAL